jgi:hypothetical protein
VRAGVRFRLRAFASGGKTVALQAVTKGDFSGFGG